MSIYGSGKVRKSTHLLGLRFLLVGLELGVGFTSSTGRYGAGGCGAKGSPCGP